MEFEIIIGLLGLSFSAISFFLSKRRVKEHQESLENIKGEIERKVLDNTKRKIEEEGITVPDNIVEKYEPAIEYMAAVSGSFYDENVEHGIESLVNKRVDEITDKIRVLSVKPSEKILKNESYNDIIDIKLEYLAKTIEAIDRKMLSKWDVAKIVSVILVLLFGVIGSLAAIISLFI